MDCIACGFIGICMVEPQHPLIIDCDGVALGCASFASQQLSVWGDGEAETLAAAVSTFSIAFPRIIFAIPTTS
jgi:hypothetical protein